MKAIRNFLLLTTAVSAAVLCSCSNTVSESETPVERTSPESVRFDWQEPYSKKLSEFKASSDFSDDPDSGSAFDLYDINGDNSPELIISPSNNRSDGCIVYTCTGGTLSELGTIGKNGIIIELPEMGLFFEEYHGDGFVIGSYYKFEEGSFVKELTYSDNSESALSGGTIIHSINDENVLMPDFEAALAPYKDAFCEEHGRKYGFGDKTIDYAINCSESWGAVLTQAEKDQCRKRLNQCMEDMETSGKHPAFEFCDLDGDKVPELIISQDNCENAACSIDFFADGVMTNIPDDFITDGYFTFDAKNFGFYYSDGDERISWNLSSKRTDPSDYGDDGNTARVGRKYALTAENIEIALG